MYDKFLERLREIRECEWDQQSIKIWGHVEGAQRGVLQGETALEAIARNMVEVLEAEESKPEAFDLSPSPYLAWDAQVMYEHKGFGKQIVKIASVFGHCPEEAKEAAEREFEEHMSDYVDAEENILNWEVRVRPAS